MAKDVRSLIKEGMVKRGGVKPKPSTPKPSVEVVGQKPASTTASAAKNADAPVSSKEG